MADSAAEEIGQWAERCRSWAKGARTPEQRAMMQSLERVLSQAATDVQKSPDFEFAAASFTPKKS